MTKCITCRKPRLVELMKFLCCLVGIVVFASIFLAAQTRKADLAIEHEAAMKVIGACQSEYGVIKPPTESVK